jgi:MoaA/NifB/PqqE/SkfB family radical SAM enzyme
MVNNQDNNISIKGWSQGLDNLKKLDCSFIAFYGAEPLEEFEKLPAVMKYAEKIGIHTTVITSGVTKDLDYKLWTLHQHGLRSITTSYDMVPLEHSSGLKSAKALEVIRRFKSFGDVRDVAVVATLTKQNFKYLPETIEQMSSKGIWTFFDLIHADRGQPGSKVRNTNADLLFSTDDFKALADVLLEVISMKKRGYLCHASEIFLKRIISQQNDVYKWNCARESSFPAWVTVDCDGTVYPCDDFHSDSVLNTKIWNLENDWDDFCKSWKSVVLSECPGCCWNTHIDACAIKRGELPLTDYIHNLGYRDHE